jgi:ABC-2 type transport system permease protein
MHVVRSEWIKLRSLRSTGWAYTIVIGMAIGMAALMASNGQNNYGYDSGNLPPAERQAHIIGQSTIFGVYFGQLVVVVLGVLIISGEYSTGMIRSTLTAVPKRLPALWAKALVLFITTAVVGLISTFGAIAIAMPILGSKGITASILDSPVFLPALTGALYLALLSVFGLGVGTMLRSSAGGIAAALGILLLLPTLWMLIPGDWARDATAYLLSNAGTNFIGLGSTGMEPWQSLLVVLAWIAVALAGAAALLKRRDA